VGAAGKEAQEKHRQSDRQGGLEAPAKPAREKDEGKPDRRVKDRLQAEEGDLFLVRGKVELFP